MTPKSAPLVSCVMATYNRRRFIPQALRCFANRTYRNAELIVVDDSERSVRSLCEGVGDVRYIRVHVTSTGAKLNLGIQAARGDVLHKIDDDDYYAPGFLQTSVDHLLGKDPANTLVTRCCFLVLIGSDGILRQSTHGWKAGGGLCFFRDLWRRNPFRDVYTAEDAYFRRDLQPEVVPICGAAEQYILVRHGRNTWNSVLMKTTNTPTTADRFFRGLPAHKKTVAELLDAESQAFYRGVLRWRTCA